MAARRDLHSKSATRPGARMNSRRVRAGIVAAGALATIGLLAGCSSSSPAATASSVAAGGSSVSSAPASVSASDSASQAAGSTTATSAAMIHISSYKYTVPASVAPGATVSVMNMDGENHTVTADSGKAFDVMAIAGKTVTFTAPMTPGSYPFHCTYHSNMHGVLVVK